MVAARLIESAGSVPRPLPGRPRFRSRRAPIGLPGALGLVVLVTIVLAGVLAPWLAPRGYDEQDLSRGLLPPVWQGGAWSHVLGTDHLGRDILSRLMYGGRTSIVLAGISVVLAAAIGVVVGLTSGYFGGRLDSVMMLAADMQMAFPYLLLAIAFMALLGASVGNLVAVLVIRSWVVYARLVRVAVLSLRTREFVTAATGLGADSWSVIRRHIAPNVAASVIVLSTLQIAELIIVESSLSFLGLGVRPPVPSWGGMVSQGREYIWTAWWVITFPGLAIVLTVLAANLLGDALHDYLNPRLRRS